MSRKIKFQTFHILFCLFAWLADKSGGWKVFTRPKLLMGSLIVGLGLTGCGMKTECKNDKNKPVLLKDSIKIVEVNQSNGIQDQIKKHKFLQTIRTYCYVPINIEEYRHSEKPKTKVTSKIKSSSIQLKESMITCYDTEITESKDTINKLESSNKIFEIVDEMPEFFGGDDALFRYIDKKTTPEVIEMCYVQITGRVFCKFIVEKDGSLTDVKVVRGIDDSMDKDAVKIIKEMPKWIPGKQNGKVVRVYYTLPINYKLE